MKILSFDTSNKALSVALLDGDQLLADYTLNIKKNHSISLMPTIDFLVAQVGWQPTDLERIVVAQGPGSYTGLRVAVATAKTLAYSLKIDLVGLSSLYALAAPAQMPGLVIPIIDARRNNVYVGFYENGRAVKPDQHMPFEDVLSLAKSYDQVAFVGEVDNFRNQIEAILPKAAILQTLPSAYHLGKLGQNLPAENVETFVPRYLKRVEAEENWLKDHEENGQTNYIRRV